MNSYIVYVRHNGKKKGYVGSTEDEVKRDSIMKDNVKKGKIYGREATATFEHCDRYHFETAATGQALRDEKRRNERAQYFKLLEEGWELTNIYVPGGFLPEEKRKAQTASVRKYIKGNPLRRKMHNARSSISQAKLRNTPHLVEKWEKRLAELLLEYNKNKQE